MDLPSRVGREFFFFFSGSKNFAEKFWKNILTYFQKFSDFGQKSTDFTRFFGEKNLPKWKFWVGRARKTVFFFFFFFFCDLMHALFQFVGKHMCE